MITYIINSRNNHYPYIESKSYHSTTDELVLNAAKPITYIYILNYSLPFLHSINESTLNCSPLKFKTYHISTKSIYLT